MHDRRTNLYTPVKVSRSDNGPFYEISSMLEDRGGNSFFIGTSFADGLHIINRHTKKTQVISFNVKPNEESILMVNDLLQDAKGIIWVLTRDDVYRYDPVQSKLISIPQPPAYMDGIRSNNYTVITEDRKGSIWIASGRNGIFCYDQQNKTYKHFYTASGSTMPLPSNVINGLTVDKTGRVWVGGRGCLGYFDDTMDNFNNIDQYGKQSKHNFPNQVYTLYTDRNGDIWAGTDAGLFYYSADEKVPVLKRVYDVGHGMRGDIVYKIQEDLKGDVWCITNSALCRIKVINGNIATFGKLDGIDNINSLHNLFLFADNKMALLSNAGYYVFDPHSFTQKNPFVPIAVTSFKIDDKEEFFEKNILTHQNVTVPAGANVISFEYAAIDLDRPDKQRYAYMLEGLVKTGLWPVPADMRAMPTFRVAIIHLK